MVMETEPQSSPEPFDPAMGQGEQQSLVYLYGFREPAVMRIDPTALASFIMGRDVPVDTPLAAALRSEFNAQERYRISILSAVQKACGDMLRQACDNVAPIEHPITDAHSAFWRGYALGKYEAYSNAAAQLSEVAVAAALAVETVETEDHESPGAVG